MNTLEPIANEQKYPKTPSKKIAVLGAGISGLAIAWYLRKKGHEVTIFEQSAVAGGCIESRHAHFCIVEDGPNTVLETSDVLKDLIKEVGLEKRKLYASDAAKTRYIAKDKALHALPTSFWGFVRTPLFSFGAKLRLLWEPFVKASKGAVNESLASFVTRRLGREFLTYAINPFVAGVSGGIPERLSVAFAFPKLYALEQQYGGIITGAIKGRKARAQKKEVAKDKAKLVSFINGLQELPQAMAIALGDCVEYQCTVQSVQKKGDGFSVSYSYQKALFTADYDGVVSTLPANSTAQILESLNAQACLPAVQKLRNMPYAPMAVLTCGFSDAALSRPLDGFGFLVPGCEQRSILGALYSSVIFPHRAAGVQLLTVFIGGMRNPLLVQKSKEELLELAVQDLEYYGVVQGTPAWWECRKWERAIPQYDVDYFELEQALLQVEAQHPGFYILGNIRGGVSLGDCVLQANKRSTEI
jgi:protoporphyrinogen/coproporphyrinogen III oxidase